MKGQTTEIKFATALITDRGLNVRRPLNEDSVVADNERHIFAVADGVGGAEAGEVASQTAVEVLREAFRHGDMSGDIEDLMEIAIQRANSSIFQMALEQPKLASMATTIVALHLKGYRATIGHVGDSRLYRISPDGRLHRETADHSVVEEEVRAGRMTPEQAANHPSRNVINRALGAEGAVEVDLKTIEVDEGTIFLLCSDGITRHIPDEELRLLLINQTDLEAACAEMKRRCYDRGAEDNLTAIVILVGQRAPQAVAAAEEADDESTLVIERPTPLQPATAAAAAAGSSSLLQRPFHDAGAGAESSSHQPAAAAVAEPAPPSERSAAGGLLRTLAVLLLLFGASVLAFYGGMRYQQTLPVPGLTSAAVPASAPAPTPVELTATDFERRREVDRAPTAMVSRMASDSGGQPLNSTDPEFLYLYGRALLLSGQSQEALKAFETSIARINENMTPERGQLKIEARFATAAAALKSNDAAAARSAAAALDDVIEARTGTVPTGPSPVSSRLP